ncbi:MAG: hypothetical protein ACK5RY_03810 [Dolichospermum sp.]
MRETKIHTLSQQRRFFIHYRGQGTGNRGQGTGNRGQGTGNS